MKNKAKVLGMLIRRYRLEQNMSQEGLCQGICAVSYLSKIEKGDILCSDEILSRLFDVLGVNVTTPESLDEYVDVIQDYFHHFFIQDFEKAASIYGDLKDNRDLLLHSHLAVDIMLTDAYSTFSYSNCNKELLKSNLENLAQYRDYMDEMQAHRFYLLYGMYETYLNKKYQLGLDYYQRAQNFANDGIILASIADAHYSLGNYLESITLGEESYTKLMQEGNVERATNICSVIAASYAHYQNIEKMLVYYNRIISLNRFNGSEYQIAHVYYNIGSAYLGVENFSKAITYLKKCFDLDKSYNDTSYVLLLQKLFLSHMGLGEKEKAFRYLELSKKFYDSVSQKSLSNSMKVSLKWIESMYYCENYLQDSKYLDIVKILYETSLVEDHRGFQKFVGGHLIKAYKAQRKYKEALNITEQLYVKNNFLK